MRNDQPELMELNHRTQLFEIIVRRLAVLRCRSGDICIDAGANVGDHALPMAETVMPGGRLHAFEPIPRLVARLRAVARERNLPLVIHETALSDHLGTASFRHIRNMTGLSGFYDHKKEFLGGDLELIEVPLTTIDTALLPLIDQCRFFKLDVECAEYHTSKGSVGVIRKFSPFIVFENGFQTTARVAGYSKEDWFALFDSLDYRTYDLYGYEVTPDRWPDHCQPYNTIAVKKGSEDEEFVTTTWRAEIDEIVAAVRSGVLRYTPVKTFK